MMLERDQACVFCTLGHAGRVVARNELVFAVRDTAPATHLHTLVLPRRHVSSYFDLNDRELAAANIMLRELQASIRAEDGSVAGFNVGANVGPVAGQTIFHCHIHLIPRRKEDVADPLGGVRAVIPSKQHY